MTAPLLSIVIPTAGRPGLAATLASIRSQAKPRDVEIIVVGDTHDHDFDADLDAVQSVIRDARALYVGHDGGEHMVGQPQRNHGMRIATGRWLAFTQDDNQYCPGALEQVLDTLDSATRRVPHLFRVMTKWRFVVWGQEGRLQLGEIDADCIVTPNEPGKLGTWTNRYEGDWDFISETVELWQHDSVWCDLLIAQHATAPLPASV